MFRLQKISFWTDLFSSQKERHRSNIITRCRQSYHLNDRGSQLFQTFEHYPMVNGMEFDSVLSRSNNYFQWHSIPLLLCCTVLFILNVRTVPNGRKNMFDVILTDFQCFTLEKFEWFRRVTNGKTFSIWYRPLAFRRKLSCPER